MDGAAEAASRPPDESSRCAPSGSQLTRHLPGKPAGSRSRERELRPLRLLGRRGGDPA